VNGLGGKESDLQERAGLRSHSERIPALRARTGNQELRPEIYVLALALSVSARTPPCEGKFLPCEG